MLYLNDTQRRSTSIKAHPAVHRSHSTWKRDAHRSHSPWKRALVPEHKTLRNVQKTREVLKVVRFFVYFRLYKEIMKYILHNIASFICTSQNMYIYTYTRIYIYTYHIYTYIHIYIYTIYNIYNILYTLYYSSKSPQEYN